MLTRLGEIVRDRLGWCPNRMVSPGKRITTGNFPPALPQLRDSGAGSPGQPVPPWELRYEHTQPGYLLLASVGGAALLLLISLFFFGAELIVLIVVCILLFVLAIMSRLTVSVSDDRLRIRFGPVGLVRKEWPLHEIVSAAAVTNPWYYGFGIRWTPHGALYNVSGSHAVEILLQSGTKVRIGTDEPDALAGAINRAIR